MQLDRELSPFNNPLVKLVKIDPVDRPSNASISLLIGEIEVSIGDEASRAPLSLPLPPPFHRNIQKLTVNTIVKRVAGTRVRVIIDWNEG